MTKKVHLDHAHLLHLLKAMIRIRHFEAKCVELYQAQKILGFLHLYDGEEAVSVGVMEALTQDDAVIATYREHGQALARGVDPKCLMAEMMGKLNGCCRGRGGSMHFFDRARRFYGGNAIVGGGLPLALGVALADKMQRRSAVTACFFGEGAVDEGEFHETLNLAKLWRLPILFVCENNLYSMGMAVERAEADIDFVHKASGYKSLARRWTAWTWSPSKARRETPLIEFAAKTTPISSSAEPIVFGRIQCSTRNSTARRMKSKLGGKRGRSSASRPGWKPIA